MLKASQLKVRNYAKYLRSLLEDSSEITDCELLEKFRHCFCCGEEIFSRSEQFHAILEFDTPKRVHEKLCTAAKVTDFTGDEI